MAKWWAGRLKNEMLNAPDDIYRAIMQGRPDASQTTAVPTSEAPAVAPVNSLEARADRVAQQAPVQGESKSMKM